ncbi:restriction endonuclease subunit S [Undibacterium sp. Di24W]|uniref:restriction endonuclease subunit S n=1 Tax=Undibacterium sp. Di24W TaxID=3413033 RepID=UPI003BEF8E7E
MEKQLIPAGYKQTEVGVIPESWRIGSLDNFWNVTDCKHVTAKFVPNGYPLASIQEVQSRFVDLTDAKQTTYEFFKLLTDGGRKLETGDLLLSRNATVGEVAQVMDWHPEFAMGQDVCLLRRKNKDDSPVFLQELFSFSTIKNQLDDCMVGTTFKRVNVKQIKALIVQMPGHQEQTAIANALSDIDALIAALEKFINKKSAIKTAAMQQLLTGKKRLPPFDQLNTGCKQTELGEIPGDWEVASLGEIGETIIGLTYSPNDVSDFGTLVLRSSNVQNNRLAFDNNVFVNMVLPDRVIVREADVLVCVRNGSRQLIGKCALIDAKTAGCAFGAFMSIYRSKNSRFVFYQFQSNIIQDQINEVMGATINQITNKDMASFRIPLPRDEKEQTAIANVLSDIDREIEALQQRLHKTQQIKQGMMQELLTGKTRLI